ncbi:MAG: hypothetical protein ACE5H7_15025 [Acidiferrobacterales bacterium]
MDSEAVASSRLVQTVQIEALVRFTRKDGLAVVAALDHMLGLAFDEIAG